MTERERDYVNVTISRRSHELLKEVQRHRDWRHVPLLDIIALAWPRCPECGGPIVNTVASPNFVCARCGREYRLAAARGGSSG
jgi:DNA-directed RNA polymerase subunit RPC12/RpoP